MIALSSAQKSLLLSNSVKKTWTFEMYNGNTFIGSIPTSQMVSDGFSIKEPLCTARSLEIGACESAVLSVKVADVSMELKGRKLKVLLSATDGTTSVSVPMGVFYVDDVKNQNNTRFYTITGYDGMCLFDRDVADWYEGLTFPTTVKAMRDSLCAYVGVTQEVVNLPNDSVPIDKTLSSPNMTGRDVLKSICAFNGCFGHFTRTGTLAYLFLGSSPALQLTKGGADCYQTGATHEKWTVQAFDAVNVIPDKDSIGGIYPAEGGTNVLTLSDNFLSYDKSTAELVSIAQAIHSCVANKLYTVHTTPTRGRPWIEAGDVISIQTENSGVSTTFNTYVLCRTLTGFQGCMDKYEASGTETVDSDKCSVNVQITQLRGRTNKLVRTVDELISEISDMDSGYKSTIQQLADKISVVVSSDNCVNAATIVAAINDNESSVKISADKVNLSGYVTINSLASGGSTVIDGSRIQTGTVSAERIDISGVLTAMEADIESLIADEISVASLDASQITSGTISAERLNLSGYVTDSELTSELSSYVTANSIETTLRSYAKTSDLSGYVTDSELTSELSSYVTSSELTTTISSYATKTGSSTKFSYSLTSTGFSLSADGSTVFNATKSGVSITGVITATSGVFSNCTIDSSCSMSGNIQIGTIFKANADGTVKISSSAGNGNGILSIDNYWFKLESGSSYLEETSTHLLVRDNSYVGSQGRNILNWTRIEGSSVQLYRDGVYFSFRINGTPRAVCEHDLYITGNWTGSSSGSISSDRNKKNTIENFKPSYDILFDSLIPRTFKYNDGTSNRVHSGFVAQEVKSAMAYAGVSNLEFAALCINYEGTENEEWSLRYEEFIALNTWQIQKLKAEVAELRALVTALQN